jgi:hypothetical protein
MRIAFDVKATIEGPKKEQVLKLFRDLQAKGHTCHVWSNSYGYAVDAIRDNKLTNTEALSKFSMYDVENYGQTMYDVAIEDDRKQTYLGAKAFVFVDELYGDLVQLVESKQKSEEA